MVFSCVEEAAKCKEASKNVTSTSRSDCKLAGEIFVGGGGAVKKKRKK